MKKALSLSLAVFLASALLSVMAGPAEFAVAQGNSENAGRPDNPGPPAGRGRAVLGPPLMFDTAGTCSIDCGDGSDPVETDAGSTIECACDCARVCDAECEATNTETGETRTCSAN